MIVNNDDSLAVVLHNENRNLLTDLETCMMENILLRIQMERDQQVALWQTSNMRFFLQRLLQETREQGEELVSLRTGVGASTPSPTTSNTVPYTKEENERPPSVVLIPQSVASTVLVPDNAVSSNFCEQAHEEHEIHQHIQNELSRLYNELEVLKSFIQMNPSYS